MQKMLDKMIIVVVIDKTIITVREYTNFNKITKFHTKCVIYYVKKMSFVATGKLENLTWLLCVTIITLDEVLKYLTSTNISSRVQVEFRKYFLILQLKVKKNRYCLNTVNRWTALHP